MSLDGIGIDGIESAALQRSGWIALSDVVFRPQDALLETAGEQHSLTPKATALLLQLCQAYPHAARRDLLLDLLWGCGRGSAETLAQVVAELRRKLGDDARAPRFIRTVSKVGFQLLSEPVALTATDPAPIRLQGQGSAHAALDNGTPAQRRGLPSPRPWMLAAAVVVGIYALIVFAPEPEQRLPPRPRSLANDAVVETMPRNAGSDGALVYALQNPDSGDFDLAFSDPGQARPRVIVTPGSDEYSPVLSADGRQLAFVRQWKESCQVLLADRDGALEREIASCQSAGPGQLIDISADGRLLAYTAPTNAAFESRAIEVRDLQTNQRLFQSDAQSPLHTDYSPRLASDGKRLSFFRHDYQTGQQALRMAQIDQDPTQSRELIPSQGERYVAHAWSPSNRFYAISNDGDGAQLVELEPARGAVIQVIAQIADGRNLAYDGQRFVYSTARVDDTFVARVDFDEGDAAAPDRVSSARASHRLPQLAPGGGHLLFASQSSSAVEIWVSALPAGASSRLLRLEANKLLALRWHADESGILALLTGADGDIELANIAFPSGRLSNRRPCHGAVALGPAQTANGPLIRDAGGRYFRSCADLAQGGSAQTAHSDAMVIAGDGHGGLAASMQSRLGIWSLDEQLQPTEQLGVYRRGIDFAWALSERWFVRLQQDPADPSNLFVHRIDRHSGAERRLRADQLDLTAGIEVGADGAVYVVLNEFDDVDIVALDWPESAVD